MVSSPTGFINSPPWVFGYVYSYRYKFPPIERSIRQLLIVPKIKMSLLHHWGDLAGLVIVVDHRFSSWVDY